MRKTTQSGVAIVEFALVLPFLFILIAITTEMGRAIYEYSTLVKSVRDAARYLSVQTPNTHIQQARNLVVYGNTAGTGNALARGLTPALVPDPVWQTVGTAPVIKTVTIEVSGYTFSPMMASYFGFAIPTLTFSSIQATMRSTL